jgi:putative acetyltransferase
VSFDVREVDPQGADALALLRLAAIEARQLYPELHGLNDPWPGNTPTPPRGSYVIAYVGNQPVAMGAHRPIDSHATEVRRMYTVASARRTGGARAVLAATEAHARGQGFRELLLETGYKQLTAMALYENLGFRRVPPFGAFASDPTSVCFAKSLRPASEA